MYSIPLSRLVHKLHFILPLQWYLQFTRILNSPLFEFVMSLVLGFFFILAIIILAITGAHN